ncbi:MAG: alpha/beta fold hydrolase [Imperialibacter sp.]|uniref:alpha/beta fold hydrolase n=1 Tax=Imperialibacter sp. TaxID=2038411 RepID=UPI003A89A126
MRREMADIALNSIQMRNFSLLLILLLSTYFYSSGQSLKSFNNGSLKLYYEEYGKGPALYILSGGPGEAPEHPYRQIVDSLKSFYTCILIHQRGSGKSRNIPINQTTISIDNYTQDIELLRAQRGDKKITLLGISWGGLLAMNYAAFHPESVSNLILVCSAPPSYTVWNVLYDNQYARRSKTELDSMDILQNVFSTKTEKELDSLKISDPSCKEVVAYKEFIALHVRAMYYDRSKISKKNNDDLFYSFNFQPIPIIDKEVIETKWDITNELKQLKTPALIVYGRQDDQGESTFYLQKESLRFSETHVIEKCGHEILEEQPVEFFSILMDYVKRAKN